MASAVQSFRSHRTTKGMMRLVAVALCLVAACLAGASRAEASTANCSSPLLVSAVIAPSSFEGGDGNLCVDISAGLAPHTDWTTLTAPQVAIPASGLDNADDQFVGNGTKEQSPQDFTIGVGSAPTPKANVLKAALSTQTQSDLSGTATFLYAAFRMFGDSGNTNLSLELNQGTATYNSTTNPAPKRMNNDVLLTFDGSGGAFNVGICKWLGQPQDESIGETASNDNYGWHRVDASGNIIVAGGKIDSNTNCTALTTLIPSQAQGGSNGAGALDNTLLTTGTRIGARPIPAFDESTIPQDTFAELSVNLDRALTGSSGGSCFAFGSAWIHTRSSSTVTSTQKDFVAPVPIPATANCKIAVTKDVSVDGGTTFADTATTSSSTTSLLWRIKVENTGSATLQDVTPADDQCDAGTTALVTAKDKDGATDGDGTFDPGDIWTYTCTTAKAGIHGGWLPGGQKVNTATVSPTHLENNVARPLTAFCSPPSGLRPCEDTATAKFASAPSPNTTASSNAAIGTQLTDSLDSFTGASTSPAPTGTVTFRLYKINTGTVNAACTTGATLVYTGSPISINSGLPVGDVYTPSASDGAGTYQWVVSYSGDTNNDAATGSCTETTERTVLSKVTPSPVTNAHITGDTVKTGPIGSGLTDDLTGFTGNVGTPTGTATFKLYKIDTSTVNAACTTGATLVHTSTAKTLSGTGTASDAYTPSASDGAGTYQWVVSYDGSSDPNNASATGSCTDTTERVTLNKVTPAPVTNAHLTGGVAKTGPIGSALTDDLTGFTGNVGTPTGTATFKLYKINTGTVNAACTTGATLVYTGTAKTLSGGTASDAYTPTASDGAGTYQWVVSYDGSADPNNNSATGSCTDTTERVTLTKVTPSPVTNAHVTGGTAKTAPAGSSITDDLTGFTGNVGTPTGTATFRLYKIDPLNPICDGTTIQFTSTAQTLSGGTASSSTTPASAGTYQWVVSYDGTSDPNNNSATGSCSDTTERVTITKVGPSPVTDAHLTGSSAKTGSVGSGLTDDLTGFTGNVGTPTGTATFRLYKIDTSTVNAACTTGATLLHTSTAKTLSGGTATDSFTPSLSDGAGTYQWVVSYDGSSDPNNASATGSCLDTAERVTLTKVTPSPVTNAHLTGGVAKTGPIGSALTDDLTGFTGNVGTPTGTATFRLYKIDTGTVNAACTTGATLVYTGTAKTLSGGTASDAYTPSLANGAGTYQWVVSYDGSSDPNNNSATGSCTDTTERVTLTKVTPTVVTDAHLTGGSAKTGPIGSGITDDLTGFTGAAGTPTGTATFRLYKINPNSPVCDGTTLVHTSTAKTLSGGTASDAYTPTASDGAGTYQWVVSYDGSADPNNNSATGSCTDTTERVTLNKVTPSPVTNAHLTGTTAKTGPIGSGVTDDLTGFTGNVGTPTGTATFRLYKINPNTVTANCQTGATLVHTSSAKTLSGGTATDAYTPTASDGAGTYQWVVSYDGSSDPNNISATGSCTDTTERVTLNKVTPAPVTAAKVTGSNPASQFGKVGDDITDQLTGFTGNVGTPTGTATFRLYKIDPNAPVCDGTTLVHTSSALALSGGTASDNYTPSLADGSGTYQWVVSYDGSADPNNNSATGSCSDSTERVTLGKAQDRIDTTPAPSTAKVGTSLKDNGQFVNDHNASGTVTYRLYKIDPSSPVCDGTTLVFTSSNRPVAGDGTSSSESYTATATGTYQWVVTYAGDNNNEPFTGSCTDTSERVSVDDPQVAIKKDADKATAHEGDKVTYTITVTNPSDAPLHDVVVSDPKCSSAPTLVSQKTGSAEDATKSTLDPGDTWTYTCSATMPAGTSFTNTATVNAKDSRGDGVPPKDASATTALIHPAIAIAKSGPGTAIAGGSVTFTLVVTNPGDTPLTTVKVTDDKCSSAPVLQSQTRNGVADPSPGTLDPGDTWTYTCSVSTAEGQTAVANTAKAEGTDKIGKTVTATAGATTQLTQPEQAVLPFKSGVADFVATPKKCVTKTFRLDVRGEQIAKVTFRVDGKKIKALKTPDAQGRYGIKINPLLRNDKRHKVTAVVQYVKDAKTADKTLTTYFKRCACISRRNFTIRLRKQFHTPLRSATVFVNGKRVKIIRGARRLKAPVKLVGLPKGRVTVKINVVTVKGKRVSGTRHYLTCNKKLKGGIPKL